MQSRAADGSRFQAGNQDNMHQHRAIIERFYTCFQLLDGEGMAQCYHADIEFSDPVFPRLQGGEVGAMWKMLCAQAQDFELVFRDARADDTLGRAHWEARYLFSSTDRNVHNRIEAAFRFQDGKIIQHHDHFNFWKWSWMALGPIGFLLGWSPLVKNRVQRQAAKGLARYMQTGGA